MTRAELTDRILELSPPLGDVEDWYWDETEAGAPIVTIGNYNTFSGLHNGDVLVCGPVPDTTLTAVFRVKPDNSGFLARVEPEPLAVEAAAKRLPGAEALGAPRGDLASLGRWAGALAALAAAIVLLD